MRQPKAKLKLFIRVSLTLFACTVAEQKRAEELEAKPNIVLLVLDDIGWADVGYHGSDFTTPTLDSLAKSGVELDRMYVMPQCSPTRSAIMTGRHAWHTGLQHFTTICGLRCCYSNGCQDDC